MNPNASFVIPQFQAPVQAPVQHNSVPTLYCNGHAFSNLWNQCGFQFPKLRIQLIIWPSLPKAAPRSFEYKVNHQAQTGHLAITSKNKIGEKHLEQHCSTVVDQTGKHRVFPRLLHLVKKSCHSCYSHSAESAQKLKRF